MRFRPPGDVPPHYRAESVETYWRIPYGERAADARSWAVGHDIRPPVDDACRTALLLVDCQNTARVCLLEDCTSPVVVPGAIDFTEETEEAFDRFADAGMRRVHSTEPLDRWGIPD